MIRADAALTERDNRLNDIYKQARSRPRIGELRAALR
jgi:hypothetical protein